jgi:hypothetical protein
VKRTFFIALLPVSVSAPVSNGAPLAADQCADYRDQQGDNSEFGDYLSYPATFQLAGKRCKIATPARFVRYHDRLFSKEFAAKIAGSVPHNAFANAQGVMIAGGAVWFNRYGRAAAFNHAQ